MTDNDKYFEASPTGSGTKLQSDATDAATKEGAKDDDLISLETLRESPVQWPVKFPGMQEFLTMSDPPVRMPLFGCKEFPNRENMTTLEEFATMTREQVIAKVKSMHDEIYNLGQRESIEMSRGKLLGIFKRNSLSPRK
ncbi:protein lin-52 homolog [Drosophila grimshawi]|uniref:GH24826 n=1 Tax=Drosophila grimshawi TaxID=7222 RepID=B4JNI3_DROGR|nr:protein lin-52 homolog [Drosophila grimshawi]EDV92276.1 GH24826 [Drosophila grimshawi]